MISLGFDTCLDKMYVVLKKDGEFLASETVENHDNKYHSAYLISTLRNVLKSNNLKPQDIDLIAVNIGPGSFTGIRACVTVARVFAQQIKCKTIGISSLEIISKSAGKNNLVALDARKNSAYLYYNEEIKGAITMDEVQKIINENNFEVITDDKLKPILGGKSYQQMNLKLGETLINLAEEKSHTDWQKLKPLYIQPPPCM